MTRRIFGRGYIRANEVQAWNTSPNKDTNENASCLLYPKSILKNIVVITIPSLRQDFLDYSNVRYLTRKWIFLGIVPFMVHRQPKASEIVHFVPLLHLLLLGPCPVFYPACFPRDIGVQLFNVLKAVRIWECLVSHFLPFSQAASISFTRLSMLVS